MNLTQLKYTLTAFRTKKTYLGFLGVQLALSIAIVSVALTSPTHFRAPSVLFLQMLLFLSLAFDLLVVRWISEGTLCAHKSNIFDLCLLCLFAATLLFLVVYGQDPDRDYREFLETDDALILVLVISRYVAQVFRLWCVIRKAKVNRQLHAELKNVNLNCIEHNHSINFNEVFKADQLVRDRISKNHVPFVEEP